LSKFIFLCAACIYGGVKYSTSVLVCVSSEAREMYDQLVPLCPIMLALTASSPALRGYLLATDCRWNIISQAIDDRNNIQYK
jgi:hypothetical protein